MIRVLLGLMLIAGACWGDDGDSLNGYIISESIVDGVWVDSGFINPIAIVPGALPERYIERIDTVWANKVPVYLSPEELKALKEILEWFKRERPDCKLGNGSEVKGILPVCNGGK